jgi:hypothetical protein
VNLKSEEGLKKYYAKIHDYACAKRLRFAVRKAMEIFQTIPETVEIYVEALKRLAVHHSKSLFPCSWRFSISAL